MGRTGELHREWPRVSLEFELWSFFLVVVTIHRTLQTQRHIQTHSYTGGRGCTCFSPHTHIYTLITDDAFWHGWRSKEPSNPILSESQSHRRLKIIRMRCFISAAAIAPWVLLVLLMCLIRLSQGWRPKKRKKSKGFILQRVHFYCQSVITFIDILARTNNQLFSGLHCAAAVFH